MKPKIKLPATKDELRQMLADLSPTLRAQKTGIYVPGKAYVYAGAPRRRSAPGANPGWQDLASGRNR